uniref:Cleft lip and palate transmembrane family protein n=2 Tax=Phytophthora ramorum TaxID=164328 RepID=H3GHI9_PHYRM
MGIFRTLWTWITFTTVSCAIFSAYMAFVGRQVYRIMYPTFSDSPNTLDPLWGEGQPLDVTCYVSPRAEWDVLEDFSAGAVHVGVFRSLTFDWTDSNSRHLDLNVSQQTLAEFADDSGAGGQVWGVLKSNASVYLHVHVTHSGFSPDPKDAEHYDQYRTIHQSSSLVKYAPRPNAKNTSLLLAHAEPQSGAKSWQETATISYWKPAASVRLVTDFTRYPVEELPVMVYQNLRYVQHPMDKRWRYLPALYVDDLSQTQDKLVPLNATLDNGNGGEVVLPLQLSWSPLSFARWQMQLTFATVFTSQEQMGVPSSDLDALRSMVTDTHPVLLAVTMSVSLLHLLFDWLAFRHDVSYWRSKGDNVVGVSLRAMAAELGSQAVVLLYLVDQDSTLLVTGPQFISVVLLVWKVTKVWRAQRRHLAIKSNVGTDAASDKEKAMDKHSLRLLEETQRADSLATSHMLFVLAPLAAGYAAYSLLYVAHAGWYAWLLESLTTTVYALGFVFMLPQLVINYRLKSVAHLQWRLLIYRALNTFIDDLFAFVIKMPTLHRISCFRDDIVFVIYLYQRWIYPVDVQRLGDVADGAPTTDQSSSKPHAE